MHAPTAPLKPSTGHCIFCDLIHGAAEVSICYEDATAMAFLDIQPVNPGHVLVVPREHYEVLQDMPKTLATHLFEVALTLIPAIQTASGAPDINVVVNSGAAAGQDVMHYHIHLIPRREGDGFDISLPFGASLMPNRQQLDGMAARIGSMLRDPLARGGQKKS
ncbi:HIT family protein [Gemmatimonas aurantiaca]|uniref:HIT family protein n=1 Tax=Gemmatimonas aurantiaca TaxID=173480 RepID=UPI00301CAFB5